VTWVTCALWALFAVEGLELSAAMRREPEPSPDGEAGLKPDHRALLDRLAAGDTIAAAAAAEFLSLRTANRRIAEARALFGARTTREAVVAYREARDRAEDGDAG
jgi:hypothetical protein